MYIGNEPLSVGGDEIGVTVNDFWRWAFSDFSSPMIRETFAEFLVASSLDLISDGQKQSKPDFDLLWNPSGNHGGVRIGVKSAAYLQSNDGEYPDRVAFHFPDFSENQACDVYIFCVFKALSQNESPFNTDLWEFYSVRGQDIKNIKNNKNINILNKIPLSVLTPLKPIWSDYYGIAGAISTVLSNA